MSTQPTDDELNALADACTPNTETGSLNYRNFAREVLALWGAPATGGEPVAWRYQDARGNYRYRGYVPRFDKDYALLKPIPLYTSPQPVREPLPESYQGSVLAGLSNQCAVTFRFGNRADAEAWHDAITDGWDAAHGITGGQI